MPKVTTRLLSFLAAFYLRLVNRTSQVIWVNRSIRDELESTGRGFLYAFWHGRQVFLVVTHGNAHDHPVVSKSKDGELIAQVCQSFGVTPVRGSSSRGGGEAVRETMALMESGHSVGFTPDGPRGPYHQIQPGILYLAKKTGRPIVPVAYGAKRRWVIKGGWDEFIIPKPLNRIAMVYGEPIQVSNDDDLEKKALELKIALDDVTHKADMVAGLSIGNAVSGCC